MGRSPETGASYSGRFEERDAFGVPSFDETKFARLLAERKRKGYIPDEVRAMMEIYRETYLDDPLRPKKPFADALRKKVAELLYQNSGAPQVKFFSTIGTPLDKKQVDAWIECAVAGLPPATVALDITQKDAAQKEGYLGYIIAGGVPEEGTKDFNFAVSQHATYLADVLRKRLQEEAETLKKSGQSLPADFPPPPPERKPSGRRFKVGPSGRVPL